MAVFPRMTVESDFRGTGTITDAACEAELRRGLYASGSGE